MPEKIKVYSQEEIEAMEKDRQRVLDVGEGDNKYTDSVKNLALAEDGFRSKMTAKSIDQESQRELANDYASVVLEKMESNKKEWEDPLTGLRNRRALMKEAVESLIHRIRDGGDCAILMLDFDHFKEVNDIYGHPGGDQALKQMAQIIESSVRADDRIYRYGGEEFTVFLENVTMEVAQVIAEKIRKKVEETIIEINDKKGKEVNLKKTISIGFASTKQLPNQESYSKEILGNIDPLKIKGLIEKDVLEPLLKMADIALYDAKREGRNRVECFRG